MNDWRSHQCHASHAQRLGLPKYSDVPSREDADEGARWTSFYEMLYDVNPGLADSRAFAAPFSIVRLSEKSKKPINAARGLYKHQRPCAISMECMYTDELVLESLRGPAKPANCSRSLRVSSTPATIVTLSQIVLTFKHAGYL